MDHKREIDPMEDVLKAARKGKTEVVEDAWMEALERDQVPWKQLIEVGKVLARAGEEDAAESQLWFLVTSLQDDEDPAAALEVALGGLAALPGSDPLREEAMGLYREVHGENERTDALMALTLGEDDLDGAEAVERLRTLEAYSPGSYVRVDPGAKFGRVAGLDPDAGLEVDLGGRSRHFPMAQLDKLQHVEPDDVRALVVFEKDRLADLAEEDPEQLIGMVLETFGGRMNLKRVRRYVLPALGNRTWGRWWSSVRKKIEQSPRIGSTGGRSPDLFVRAEPVDRAEQLRRRLDRAKGLQKLSEARDILGETPQDEGRRRELLTHISEELVDLADRSAPDAHGLRLGALAVLEEVAREAPDAVPEESVDVQQVLEEIDLRQGLTADLLESAMMTTVLEHLPSWMPERWGGVVGEMMPDLPEKGCRWAAGRLASEGDGELLEEAAETILATPNPHPGAVIWLWKAATGENVDPALEGINRLSLLRKLLSVVASVSRGGEMPKKKRKAMLSRARNALLSAGEGAIEEAAQEASDEEISALMAQVERNQGLTRKVRARAARSIRAARPELFRTSIPAWKQKVIYTTEKGRQKRAEQYDYIINERMPEVIREIGEAAELGDLSENAEYTAALEERGRLSEQAGQIKDELSRARIITHELASASHVTVGTHVQVRDTESGEERELTFVGPWDAEPSDGVYSYQAPLSQKFMGKTTGERVTLTVSDEKRTYEIEQIEPAV
jgi:transcription elongation factor GreA